MKKSETRILHNFCATWELKKKHNTHTHENTRQSQQKQNHTLVGIVSAGYSQFVNSDSSLLWVPANLSQQPGASSSALLLLLFAGWISCHVTKNNKLTNNSSSRFSYSCYSSSSTLLLLLLTTWNLLQTIIRNSASKSRSSSRSVCVCEKQTVGARGRTDANVKNLDWPEVETWNPKKTLRKP